MRNWILGVALAAFAAGAVQAAGSHAVRGYTRSDGTYVQPHMQTNPNNTKADNWSTKGNFNPYTGKEGTKPDTAPVTPPAPAGVTAVCGDGSFSFSQSRSGTCSSHGGVATWK